MATYDVGDLVRVTGTFTTAAGVATDPTVVKCQIRDPANVIVTLTYGVDAALIKSATGVYYTDVDVTMDGRWRYRFYSTGVGQAAGENTFSTTSSYFD